MFIRKTKTMKTIKVQGTREVKLTNGKIKDIVVATVLALPNEKFTKPIITVEVDYDDYDLICGNTFLVDGELKTPVKSEWTHGRTAFVCTDNTFIYVDSIKTRVIATHDDFTDKQMEAIRTGKINLPSKIMVECVSSLMEIKSIRHPLTIHPLFDDKILDWLVMSGRDPKFVSIEALRLLTEYDVHIENLKKTTTYEIS